ncbi:hypothetical protein [Duganella callida]|uniref:Uncharacterized protein n=1 Tax=Duganella callida TaxID=2561932 RepID=A0A4Y9S7C2_9BURK|nr:hypothetical protein [Duganella callida]TFW15937.1 hypothetical protein E4L98_24900 [Duganella callida]
MSTILQQGPAPDHPGTPEGNITLAAREWREKDRDHIAEKSATTGAAEYRARRKLRMTVDLNAPAGQP